MTNYINKARQGRVKALTFLQQKQMGAVESAHGQRRFGNTQTLRRSEMNLWATEFDGMART